MSQLSTHLKPTPAGSYQMTSLLETPSNSPCQTPYYLAVIEITNEGLEHLAENELTLIAGMPAEVFIKTGERTLFQYLADPLVNTVARSFIED